MKKKKRKKRRPWLDYIEYLIFICIVKFFSIIPYRWASDIGGFLGCIGYRMDARHRNIALRNLSIAFPEEGKGRLAGIAKKSFENIGRSAAEFLHVATQKADVVPNIIHDWITVEGRDNLDKAINKGKGLLYLTAHFGNWELLGITLAAIYPLNEIVRPIDNRRIDGIITSMRNVTGASVLPKKGVLRDTLKKLRKGEAVVILLDQNTSRREGVFVDFFGHPAATNRGMALIALKSESPVIPLFIIREGAYRHRVIYAPEVILQRSKDLERDVISNTERFTKVIESYIRNYPEQWFWMHQRWKTRPK
ncbi:MAG: lysophospholipid acyltransferase family protein [Nitrospirae bacterium]|nr:lysophospholipid acyltransferase family protein [Nitrospirota bacterium]